jgi:predicted transposase
MALLSDIFGCLVKQASQTEETIAIPAYATASCTRCPNYHRVLLDVFTPFCVDTYLLRIHNIHGTLFDVDKTIQCELQLDSELSDALDDTLQQFTDVYNFVCTYGWNAKEKNDVRLHHAIRNEGSLSRVSL